MGVLKLFSNGNEKCKKLYSKITWPGQEQVEKKCTLIIENLLYLAVKHIFFRLGCCHRFSGTFQAEKTIFEEISQ